MSCVRKILLKFELTNIIHIDRTYDGRIEDIRCADSGYVDSISSAAPQSAINYEIPERRCLKTSCLNIKDPVTELSSKGRSKSNNESISVKTITDGFKAISGKGLIPIRIAGLIRKR